MCDKVKQLEEQLSRVEAERDAKLAEAVELFRALSRSRSYSGMLNIMLDVKEFLSRHAQAEQQEAQEIGPLKGEFAEAAEQAFREQYGLQEAQGAQAGDEKTAKAIYDADRSVFMTNCEYTELHDTAKARLRKMALAALVTQPASPADPYGDEEMRKPDLVGYFSFCEDKQKWLQQKPKGAEFNHLFTPLYAIRDQAGEGGE